MVSQWLRLRLTVLDRRACNGHSCDRFAILPPRLGWHGDALIDLDERFRSRLEDKRNARSERCQLTTSASVCLHLGHWSHRRKHRLERSWWPGARSTPGTLANALNMWAECMWLKCPYGMHSKSSTTEKHWTVSTRDNQRGAGKDLGCLTVSCCFVPTWQNAPSMQTMRTGDTTMCWPYA